MTKYVKRNIHNNPLALKVKYYSKRHIKDTYAGIFLGAKKSPKLEAAERNLPTNLEFFSF